MTIEFQYITIQLLIKGFFLMFLVLTKPIKKSNDFNMLSIISLPIFDRSGSFLSRISKYLFLKNLKIFTNYLLMSKTIFLMLSMSKLSQCCKKQTRLRLCLQK
jgi:hypothetical protein